MPMNESANAQRQRQEQTTGGRQERCETPCVDHATATRHYSTCTNKYGYSWIHDPPPCVPVPQNFDDDAAKDTENYNKLFNENLIAANAYRSCYNKREEITGE